MRFPMYQLWLVDASGNIIVDETLTTKKRAKRYTEGSPCSQ